LSQATCAQG
jgi:hypothetical protein